MTDRTLKISVSNNICGVKFQDQPHRFHKVPKSSALQSSCPNLLLPEMVQITVVRDTNMRTELQREIPKAAIMQAVAGAKAAAKSRK